MAAPAISKGMFATDVDGNVWMKALRLIRRSRVLHMVFWGYSWYALVHMLQQHSPERSLTVIHHSSTATILFQMMMVYTIVYGLLPRYFARGQLVRFVLTALLAVLVFSVAVVYVKELWMRLVVDPGYTLNHKMVIMSNLMDSVVLAFIWTVIYVAEHLFLKDRHHARMEQQRLRTELDHLKAQLNPHFLFNTLNSIHVIMR
ncbi:MAG TPA: histidine kinase, partial [Flavobacteriales bacterium]|nr:histidine kinase [Flavobacteriales bacterium]